MGWKRIIKKTITVVILVAAAYIIFVTDIAKVHTGIAYIAKRYLDQQQERHEELVSEP